MSVNKPLPRGISTLKEIITDGYLYIDKTKIIHHFITTEKYCFLARPRRFGKSLLVSTLKEIFQGNKKLFANLWIGKKSNYAWQKHPVIHLDLSTIDSSTPEKLEIGLCEVLHEVGRDLAVDVSNIEQSGARLIRLVKELSTQGRVVILIDEYDAPITSTLYDIDLANNSRRALRSFYAVIKSLDQYIKFFFLTGVSRFTHTSLFSGLNNLTDISLYPQAAALVGYTQEEIEHYLLPYVDIIAATRSTNRQSVLDEMREWYNGYRFSESLISVYNPFSMFHYLYTQKCSNYWSNSATPTFLIDLLKKGTYSLENLNSATETATSLGSFNLDAIELAPLLFQTGYLTIQSYSELTHQYTLVCPNKEVKVSLGGPLLSFFCHTSESMVRTILNRLRQALIAADMETFCNQLQSLLAGIPYNLHLEKEAYYHSILQTIMMMLGFDVQCEVLTSIGRIDMAVHIENTAYIFEFKCNKTAAEALAQIKEMRYAEKYTALGKKTVLIGMNFSYPNKELHIDWAL
jgi:hypothetical protein